MGGDVVRDRLEVLEQFLGLVDNLLVLEDGAVVRDVDRGRLRRERVAGELRVVVTFAEGLQRGDRLCTRALIPTASDNMALRTAAKLQVLDESRKILVGA